MFCPNCGTKNEEVVEKCAQCGFDLQSSKKTAAPKFKGTMMLQASPVAGSSSVAPGSPAAPGAPAPAATAPSVAAPAPEAAAAAAQPKPMSMKGTMVGLAPPNMEELRRQMAEAAASQAASKAAAAPAASTGPVASAPVPSAAVGPTPSSKLKGTMIGVAPPSMADMAKALQEQREALQASQAAGQPAATQAAAAPSVPPAGAGGSSHPSGAARPASVAMKGTMLGVAPPDIAAMQASLSKAAQNPSATASSQLGGTMVGVAPEDVAELRAKLESERPPAPAADVNAFGGTVVGTSPFFGLDPAGEEAARQRLASESGSSGSYSGARPFDASDATPAESPAQFGGASNVAAQYAQRAAADPGDLRAPVYRPPGPVPGLPVKNNTQSVVILLIGVILVICLVLAAFVL